MRRVGEAREQEITRVYARHGCASLAVGYRLCAHAFVCNVVVRVAYATLTAVVAVSVYVAGQIVTF